MLLKLAAPPMVRLDWLSMRPPLPTMAAGAVAGVPIEATTIEGRPHSVDYVSARVPAPKANEHDPSFTFRKCWRRARRGLLCLWIGGASLCALIAATRAVRFERRLRGTLPASDQLRSLAAEVAAKLGVRRLPELRCAECIMVPLLWWAGRRPMVILPTRLLGRLDEERAALVLAHELAHLRRGDHWVRLVELLISIAYWWHPIVWLVRRRLHGAEEQCCDAWVCWAFPGCNGRYAETLLQAAELLGAGAVGGHLLPVSSFLRSFSLKVRIEMILTSKSRFSPRVSIRAMLVVATMALVVLPFSFGGRRQTARAESKEEAAAAGPANVRSMSEFPYAVDVEQGATQFEKGDDITILEIRGTAEKFMPGHIYWIRGKYTLTSHKKAMLAAYTTAMDAENGASQSFRAQHLDVNEGEGTFTLFLPMSYRGWPHVSFYAESSSFGGNYFGTGDSVLKRRWGSKDTDKTTINVSRDGTIELDGHAMRDLGQLTRRLTDARRQNAALAVLVRGDSEVRFQRMAGVLNACKQAGLSESKLSIKVLSPPAE
ncbi:MAG TPA: M56 family metallopeptidase [Pirellulales bacterium]|nr:M56 family metallopeptidase [Pirellulales bacterium]